MPLILMWFYSEHAEDKRQDYVAQTNKSYVPCAVGNECINVYKVFVILKEQNWASMPSSR